MKFMSPSDISTDDWAPITIQHPRPDWSTVDAPPFAERGRRWTRNPTDQPWFDRPGALDKVQEMRESGLVTRTEDQYLRQWITDGYFVIEDALASDEDGLLDQYNRELDGVWTADSARDNLYVSGVRKDGVRLHPVEQAELLSWPLDLRMKLRDTQVWRIHYFQPFTPAGLAISKTAVFVRMVSILMQEDPVLLDLTAYKYSSEVAVHQDLWFYHLHPLNHMVGIWFATEDVRPGSGPLVIYPGSHRLPTFPGYSNYPQTNYRTDSPAGYGAIDRYLSEQVVEAGIAPMSMPVKRGTAIFLNGLLSHKTELATKRGDYSRRSMVLHYSRRGCNRADEVQGPFNY